jgi:RNA polymerase sigma-70 factor (ECF subfamily)
LDKSLFLVRSSEQTVAADPPPSSICERHEGCWASRLMESQRVEQRLASLRGEMMKVAMCWVQRPADADDLVQAALMRALEKADRIPLDNLAAWLRTILKHLAIDGWRRQRHEVALDERLSGLLEAPVSEARPWWYELGIEDVRTALPHCRETYRRVYEMYLFDGLAPDAIARQLGIAVGTVATRLFRARAQLRQILQEHRRPPVRPQPRMARSPRTGAPSSRRALAAVAVAA